MAATIDGDITDKDIAAELEGYRLIARSDVAAVHHTTLLGILLGQTLTVNHSTTGNGNMFLPDGVDKTVLEIRMAAILISRTFPRLSLIVCLHRGRSRQNLGTSRKMQLHMALHADAAAEISTRRHHHPAATMRHTTVYGSIDGMVVERLAIALGSIVSHIVICR